MRKPNPKAPDASTLRQRAAQARDAAGRFIRHGAGKATDQPQPASLPEGSPAECRDDAFKVGNVSSQDPRRARPEQSGRADAAGGRVPRLEQDMGRHETFENAAPIAEELLAGTALGHLLPAGQIGLTARDACPVFAIGTQLGRLVAEHTEQDRASIEAHRANDRKRHQDAGRRMERAQEGIALLREAATYQRATSLEGALAHVVIAAGAVAEIVENESLDDDGRQERVNTAFRCLHSIAKVLSASTGVSPRSLGSSYLMGEWSDALGGAWSAPEAAEAEERSDLISESVQRSAASVEQQLLGMNGATDAWRKVYLDAIDLETGADENRELAGAAAKKAMADMATAHAVRLQRQIMIKALALPATSVRELGLQARIVACELREWWDNNEQQAGELACRQLLDRLMGLAGVSHIADRDLAVAEVRSWISDPLAYVRRYPVTATEHKGYNHDLPSEA